MLGITTVRDQMLWALESHRFGAYRCTSMAMKPYDLPVGSWLYETDTDKMYSFTGSDWVRIT